VKNKRKLIEIMKAKINKSLKKETTKLKA